MPDVKPLNAWKQDVHPVLVSKAEEFQLLGYDTVTTEHIWDCVMAKLARKKREYLLHQLVNEIFKLSPNEYMNWLTIQAVTSEDINILDKENQSLLGID